MCGMGGSRWLRFLVAAAPKGGKNMIGTEDKGNFGPVNRLKIKNPRINVFLLRSIAFFGIDILLVQRSVIWCQ